VISSQPGKRDIFRKYPDVVDVPQLCEMLGGDHPICAKTAYKLLRDGRIPSVKVGRSYRIPKINVIHYLFYEQSSFVKDVDSADAPPAVSFSGDKLV
jgi:excisionase family DNA binding protein